MLEIHIITLFPEYFYTGLKSSLLGRAIENKLVAVNLIQLRDFATNRHRKVDDAPYGGGSGMILMVEPLVAALRSIVQPSYKILLTPRGQRLNQGKIRKLYFEVSSAQKSITLICGHYEGFDERIVNFCDASISIGDFILSGGEPAAMVIVDAMARLIPGFMGNEQSTVNESFERENHQVEYPQFTRPREFEGLVVPDILLSGNHQAIEKWRENESREDTLKFRQ